MRHTSLRGAHGRFQDHLSGRAHLIQLEQDELGNLEGACKSKLQLI